MFTANADKRYRQALESDRENVMFNKFLILHAYWPTDIMSFPVITFIWFIIVWETLSRAVKSGGIIQEEEEEVKKAQRAYWTSFTRASKMRARRAREQEKKIRLNNN